MSLLQEMQSHAGSYDIAIVAATISILLGGILFGTGLGFGIRRIRLIGAEEIGQGIISAAMVGGLFAFTVLLDSSVSSLVPQGSLSACPSVQNPAGSPFGYCECNLEALSFSLASLSSSISRSADISGFASSLQVSVGAISAQPFFAAQAASQSLSDVSGKAQAISSLAFLERVILETVRSSALSLFLPAGLILRTFFATRKIGAAAMAIAIAAYLAYPLVFLYTFSTSKSIQSANEAAAAASSFNADFAALPLLDLDQTAAVRGKIDEMSQGDFGGKLQQLFPAAYRALYLAGADLLLYPLISLAISYVAALELYRMLSAPVFLPYFESV